MKFQLNLQIFIKNFLTNWLHKFFAIENFHNFRIPCWKERILISSSPENLMPLVLINFHWTHKPSLNQSLRLSSEVLSRLGLARLRDIRYLHLTISNALIAKNLYDIKSLISHLIPWYITLNPLTLRISIRKIRSGLRIWNPDTESSIYQMSNSNLNNKNDDVLLFGILGVCFY